jgi:hypothetical protein
MIERMKASKTALRLTALIALVALLAGCGSGLKGSTTADASEDAAVASCPESVMDTLGSVLGRVYREGISSERTASARHMIEGSSALRSAVEGGNSSAARAAARALLRTGHLTDLRVLRGKAVLVDLGGPALAPLHGSIADASGKPIASYVTSVWADSGFSAEGSGVAEGFLALRAGERSIGGTLSLPAGALPREGTLTRRGVEYQYTSFAGQRYPSGSPVGIYLLKPLSAIEQLCGTSPPDTVVNTLKRVAELIYAGEAGPRTLVQIHRVQRNVALQRAVAARDPVATRAAVAALLHQHIVRLRVSAAGRLLSDLGGPFVLAPVRAELHAGGRKIGSFVLSIQDDEGYLRLTGRLAGLRVLMYMRSPSGVPRLVKNSLGPAPGRVPASGSYTYRGQAFSVFTVNATAFPSGPLTIRVLVPMPYS